MSGLYCALCLDKFRDRAKSQGKRIEAMKSKSMERVAVDRHETLILIAISEDRNLNLTKILLERALPNYKILTANTNFNAINTLISREISLVVLDADFGGLDILRRIREDDRFKTTPVMMMSSSTKRELVAEVFSLGSGGNIRELDNKIAIHINDTHPALCVAELMRIMIDDYDLEWDEAWKITRGVVAYTNHTIMPEALEKWPVDMFKTLLPRIYMVIDEVNRRHLEYVRARYPNNVDKLRAMSIIEGGEVHMARLAIVGSHSVNGVARIHSDILKSTTLHDFYEYWPRMFNNKTNGITHRRWLMGANPELADLIDRTIRSRVWHRHPEQLDLFNEAVDDRKVQKELDEIKLIRKTALADFIKKHQGVELDPNTIFDIQVKRIHSYKRQLMNALHIIWQYEKIKADPSYKPLPTTYLFGGKAAAGYYIAKETIRLINAIANKINNDKSIDNRLKVVFIENFGVSIGEIVYPAADVSEQISTASKEASGTGNMKFMMNGAITLGTLDGANVEIREAVGDDNIVIFGLKAGDVLAYYENGTYSAWNEYTGNPNARLVVDKLTDGSYGNFHSLRDYLIQGNDEFFILKDFNAYIDAHEEIYARYADRSGWLRSGGELSWSA